MKVVLIDHEDSFVYNLAQALGGLGADVVTLRSSVALSRVVQEDPDAIVLSPGPGHPSDLSTMGVTPTVLSRLSPRISTLGVCLGHQAIGSHFGARVVRAPRPSHGEIAQITHHGGVLYEHVPSPFPAARYHSLMVDPASLPPELEPTSWEETGVLMGVRHRKLPVEGVQFHPESYMTRDGRRILSNFLKGARR